jgi:hypothetical protein
VAKYLGVGKNKCTWHKTVIARKGGKMIKYFSSKEAFEKFYEIICRACNVSLPVIVEPIQNLISDYLEADGELVANIHCIYIILYIYTMYIYS